MPLSWQTMGRNLFGRELSHLACVLGGFVVYAVLSLIPFFGGAFTLAVSMLAVGIALLTKFGAEEPWGQRTILPPQQPGSESPPPDSPSPPAEPPPVVPSGSPSTGPSGSPSGTLNTGVFGKR